jgi:hypothetical protein
MVTESYSETLTMFKDSLITHCKRVIIKNWGVYFKLWLDSETDIGDAYRFLSKEYFKNYVTQEVENDLYMLGQSTVYAVKSFLVYSEDADIDDVVEFVEILMTTQFENFEEWGCCGDIIESMSTDE